jgi:small subunit ribosomal protein S9
MYLQNQVELPLKTIESIDSFDVVVTVAGGGPKGQAEAIKLGIARALCEINPEYRPTLKHAGLMTRDPRSVERKKFGKRKARRSFQFSKR